MKCEVIDVKTKEVVYSGNTIKECKEWGKNNGFRSPQYYVRAKKKYKKYHNDWDGSCIDQSDISNF